MIDLEHYKAQAAAFRTRAREVHDLYVGRLQAYSDERAAAATLLDWIREEVRPALPVLGGNVYASWDNSLRRGTAFPERGLPLLGAVQRNGNAWGGKQLVLFVTAPPYAHAPTELPYARLARLTFGGDALGATLAERTWLTAEQALQEWPADKILGALHDRLLEELEGKAVDKRDDAVDRTRKLRAVLELLA
jgi:hypothetical protein